MSELRDSRTYHSFNSTAYPNHLSSQTPVFGISEHQKLSSNISKPELLQVVQPLELYSAMLPP